MYFNNWSLRTAVLCTIQQQHMVAGHIMPTHPFPSATMRNAINQPGPYMNDCLIYKVAALSCVWLLGPSSCPVQNKLVPAIADKHLDLFSTCDSTTEPTG